MRSDEIQGQIREEHRELRGLLTELDQLVDDFQHGEGAAGHRLRERGLVFYERLRWHLDEEERLLVPALRAIGEEGERRAARLMREHEEQRQLLRYLLGRLEQSPEPTAVVVQEIRNFVRYVRQDMDHEEEHLLRRSESAST